MGCGILRPLLMWSFTSCGALLGGCAGGCCLLSLRWLLLLGLLLRLLARPWRWLRALYPPNSHVL